jgi:metallo-beta-lactamase class B
MSLRNLFIFSVLLLPAVAAPMKGWATPQAASSSTAFETLSPSVKVRRLAEHTWLHVSTMKTEHWGEVPSNGLLVVTSAGSILLDTAWNDEQTRVLLLWAETHLHAPVRKALVTHAHEDRMGGIRSLLAASVEVIGLDQTAKKMLSLGFPPLQVTFQAETSIRLGDQTIDVFYPGPGHIADNVVAWIPGDRVLHGGCLVKEQPAKSLGNLADADVKAWPASLRRVLERYPSPAIVIPGHGAPGDLSLVRHTLDLLREVEGTPANVLSGIK